MRSFPAGNARIARINPTANTSPTTAHPKARGMPELSRKFAHRRGIWSGEGAKGARSVGILDRLASEDYPFERLGRQEFRFAVRPTMIYWRQVHSEADCTCSSVPDTCSGRPETCSGAQDTCAASPGMCSAGRAMSSGKNVVCSDEKVAHSGQKGMCSGTKFTCTDPPDTCTDGRDTCTGQIGAPTYSKGTRLSRDVSLD